MATLPETSSFDATVNRILETDPVLGDIASGAVAGPANLGPQNLTNRTRWLFDQNTANVSNIAALTSAITLLAPLNSPNFSGTPTAPNPPIPDASQKIPTTLWVAATLASYAPINSPALTGFPTAPTQPVGDSSTRLATTAFVNRGGSLGGNGWRENPDGTIEQWGLANPAGGGVTVTFPFTFPNACYAVVALSVAGGGVQTWLSANPTTSSFSLHNTGGTAFWKAIGK
jgi:hypothetical protein